MEEQTELSTPEGSKVAAVGDMEVLRSNTITLIAVQLQHPTRLRSQHTLHLMAEMPQSSFPLFLRPSQDKSDTPDLTTRLRQIVNTKGHLRTVTEAALQDGVAEEHIDDSSDVAADEEVEDKRGTLDHLGAIKQQMVQMVTAAHEQSMYTVDFLSLLLSKYSAQGQNSMSVALKQQIPPKTLAFEKLPVTVSSDEDRATLALIAQGQRLKGMTAAADALLGAASRLEKEVNRETTYWQETLSIADAGWSVCRVSRENKRQLGVQLGFADAGPLYKGKGFVALNTLDDGTSSLDERVVAKPKTIRVRLVSKGEIVGTSRRQSPTIDEDKTIEDRIKSARDSLFEQELFHEIALESQSLTAYGVRWRDSVIRIGALPVNGSNSGVDHAPEILIDLVSQDLVYESVQDCHHNNVAEHVSVVIRILMLHVYRQRLQGRSKPPPLYSETRRKNEAAKILRPLLNYNNHQSSLIGLRNYTNNLRAIFRRAGLSSADVLDTKNILEPILNSSNPVGPRELVDCFTGALTTTVVLPLPSLQGDIRIGVQSSLQASAYMSEFKLQVPQALRFTLDSDNSKSETSESRADSTRELSTFYTLRELLSYLDFVLAMDIAHNVVAPTNDNWTAIAQNAEVDAPAPERMSSRRIVVSCSSVGLLVRWKQVKGYGGSARWTPEDGNEPLRDVLQKLAST